MPKEFELRFLNYNKKNIISKLKDLGAERVHKPIIYKYTVFEHPLNLENTYIRLRKEGDKTTFTYKHNTNEKFVDEHEVFVSDYDTMLDMLYMIGFKKKFSIQKLREKWKIKGCKEIVFDIYPGAPEYMEIECDNEKNIHILAKKLGLDTKKEFYIGDIYFDLYGIEPPNKDTHDDLTFDTCKTVFNDRIKKNKKMFNKIVKHQISYVKSLK
jgi:adenylate cyclase class 2